MDFGCQMVAASQWSSVWCTLCNARQGDTQLAGIWREMELNDTVRMERDRHREGGWAEINRQTAREAGRAQQYSLFSSFF